MARARELAGPWASVTLWVIDAASGQVHRKVALPSLDDARHAGPLHWGYVGLDGDRIYEEARRTVMAQMQVITYREFLPALVGEDALPPYRGYRPDADGTLLSDILLALTDPRISFTEQGREAK